MPVAPRKTTSLLLHPVRLRVVQALLGDRRMTTTELGEELGDVSAATLYRHVSVLAAAGVLEVVAEQRVRGTIERTYALRLSAAQVDPDELASMTTEDHRQAFTAFTAGLLADFERYLAREEVDLARDGVGYRQNALWLSDGEFEDLLGDLRAVLQARADNGPAPGRVRRLITLALMPGSEPLG
jgi:DNA-binding transcriptional ArsR family regulator